LQDYLLDDFIKAAGLLKSADGLPDLSSSAQALIGIALTKIPANDRLAQDSVIPIE
jgi:hypothetical protein